MKALGLVTALLCSASLAAAQSPLSLVTGSSGAAGLDIVRAESRHSEGTAGFVTAHVALSPRFSLVADLPIAQAAYVPDPFVFVDAAPCPTTCPLPPTYSMSSLGNPYVGLRVGGASSAWYQEIGLRVPGVLLEDGDAYGFDLVREVAFMRAEAFAPRGMAFVALTGVERPVASFLTVRARAGAIALLGARQGDAVLEVEAVGAWRALRLGALSQTRIGLPTLEHQAGDLWGARLGAEAALQLGDVRPSVYVRAPVGGREDARLGSQLGLSLALSINR